MLANTRLVFLVAGLTASAGLAQVTSNVVPPSGLSANPELAEGSLSDDDYPPEAIRRNQAGIVVADFVVLPDGTAHDCHIIATSSFDALDQRTCELISTRFRFRPGKDKSGKPVASGFRQRIKWVIPSQIPPIFDLRPRNVDIEMIVAPDGTVKSCQVIAFASPFKEQRDVACPWATQGQKLAPSTGTRDRRVRYHNSLEVRDVD